MDGWSESAQVVQFLIELSENFKCIFLKGNHDFWCEKWLAHGEVNATWYMHGGKETIASYDTFSPEEKTRHSHFFNALQMYYINETTNQLFIHAGFTSPHGVSKELYPTLFTTDRTLWEMVLAMDKTLTVDSKFYPKRLTHYNEIFIGHTATTNYDITTPMHFANVWNIDTGAAFTGCITAIDIETKTYVQSDVVQRLYANEVGRNKTKMA